MLFLLTSQPEVLFHEYTGMDWHSLSFSHFLSLSLSLTPHFLTSSPNSVTNKQTKYLKKMQTTRSNRLLPLSCGSRCDRRGTSALSPQLPVWLHTAPAFVSPQRLASWRLRTARARVCYVPPCLVTGRGAWPGDRTTSSTARFHARATVRKSGPGLDTPGESVSRSKGNTMSDEVRFTILLSFFFFGSGGGTWNSSPPLEKNGKDSVTITIYSSHI